MTVAEFRRLLKKGLGRAILFAQANDLRPYREVILQACLHNWAYDKQVEPNRAAYLFEIIKLTHEERYYRDEILRALETRNDEWDFQLYDLARMFAQEGDAEARQVIYDTFAKNYETDFMSGETLIALDGLAGYIFIAETLGGMDLLDEENWWLYDLLHGYAEKRFGEEATWAALYKAGESNARVAQYRIALQTAQSTFKDKLNRNLKPVKNMTYAQLKVAQLSQVSLSAWGQKASDSDLLQAAEDLLKITDEKLLSRYLFIFRKRTFPLDPHPLIDLVFHQNNMVRFRAITALTNMELPELHVLAIKLIQSRMPDREEAVNLFVRNFREDDFAVVEAFSEEIHSRSGFHALGFAVKNFYKTHPNPVSEIKVLLRLYEVGPCTMCRGGFVRRLIELEALPDWMRAECNRDSEIGIRRMANGESEDGDD
jgi:hypothetical protein